MKPTLKAPGTKLLKLKCDEPLSNFAFNVNVHRYIEATAAAKEKSVVNAIGAEYLGGAVQVDSIKPCVESAPGFSD
jgi:hypothetical protein